MFVSEQKPKQLQPIISFPQPVGVKIMMTDTHLQNHIIAELKWDYSIDAAKTGVEVDIGVVALSGHVGKYTQQWKAERAAQKVCGVKAPAEEIKAVLQGLNNSSDADIARTTENVLEWTTNWPRDDVKVSVENGWVSLSGELNYEYQRQLTTAPVRYLIGDTGVSNQTTIKPTLSSLSIKSDIQAALKLRSLIDAEEVIVAANGGEVNLFGVVKSWSERDLVSNSVLNIPCVTHVTDNISVAN